MRIHGAYDVVTGQGIEQVMEVQMQYSYFPIREAELRAAIDYRTLEIGEVVEVGDATVTGTLLNHPVIDLVIALIVKENHYFLPVTTTLHNIYEPDDEVVEHQLLSSKQRQMDVHFPVSYVSVMDGSYTDTEYPSKKGWGHSTFDYALDLARVSAKRLCYHEPTRSDADAERVFNEFRARCGVGAAGDPEVLLAHEGLVLDI